MKMYSRSGPYLDCWRGMTIIDLDSVSCGHIGYINAFLLRQAQHWFADDLECCRLLIQASPLMPRHVRWSCIGTRRYMW